MAELLLCMDGIRRLRKKMVNPLRILRARLLANSAILWLMSGSRRLDRKRVV